VILKASEGSNIAGLPQQNLTAERCFTLSLAVKSNGKKLLKRVTSIE
jgi:hypothetical protein